MVTSGGIDEWEARVDPFPRLFLFHFPCPYSSRSKKRDGVEKGTGNWDKIGKGKVYLFLTSHPQPSATGWWRVRKDDGHSFSFTFPFLSPSFFMLPPQYNFRNQMMGSEHERKKERGERYRRNGKGNRSHTSLFISLLFFLHALSHLLFREDMMVGQIRHENERREWESNEMRFPFVHSHPRDEGTGRTNRQVPRAERRGSSKEKRKNECQAWPEVEWLECLATFPFHLSLNLANNPNKREMRDAKRRQERGKGMESYGLAKRRK